MHYWLVLATQMHNIQTHMQSTVLYNYFGSRCILQLSAISVKRSSIMLYFQPWTDTRNVSSITTKKQTILLLTSCKQSLRKPYILLWCWLLWIDTSHFQRKVIGHKDKSMYTVRTVVYQKVPVQLKPYLTVKKSKSSP